MQEIRIVGETDNQLIWRVEWIPTGHELRMTARTIRADYVLALAPKP